MKKILSSVLSLFAWLFVGLVAVSFVSTSAATLIGFVAFVIVAALTYPKTTIKAR